MSTFRGSRAAAWLVALGLLAGTARGGGPIVFREVAEASGVRFRFDDGSRGRRDLPEIMGGGLAWIDGDGDGRPDLYLCNGGPIEARDDAPDAHPCRYFRNAGDGRFVDATADAHAPGPSYAMGASVGDFDGDGRDDLFVTGWRGQRLYRNLGGGAFADVTARAGVASTLWSTSSAWCDLDGDGDLDLYVAGYLRFDPSAAPFCAAPDGRRDYCGPEDFPAEPDRLYRNNGDGTFTDVARDAGVDLPEGRGLGVLIADVNDDARPDVFVANDGAPCWLFENFGGMRFREAGMAAGLALDGRGGALAAMGAAFGDVDGDGRPDLAVSNFLGRGTVGFRGLGRGLFADHSEAMGLTGATRKALGFGLALEDFDGDGRLDLLQANGHVQDRARLGTPFAMRPTLLRNVDGRLRESGGGPWFDRPFLGRGLAVADFDGDGRPDAAVGVLRGPTALLRNVSEGRSIGVDLASRSGRPAFGAAVAVEAGDLRSSRVLAGGGSYLSGSQARLFFGVGAATRLDRVEVRWPWGGREEWRGLAVGTTLRIVEGTGRPVR